MPVPRMSLPAAITMVAACAMVLSGCDAIAPTADQTPAPSPVFASEEQALAAATEAYAEYQAALDEAFRTLDHRELAEVATGRALEEGITAVEEYRVVGQRQTGATSIDTVSLIDPRPALAGEAFQLYACLDVSGVDVRDASGVSITPPDRAMRFPLVATLEWISEERGLAVSEEEQWTGADFCS